MELDRQAIERKDFPIGRRGYDPDEVDAHLRGIAAEFEELERAAAGRGPDVSLASAAGRQVHSILAAAEAAAAEIERAAQEAARETREAAERDAEGTREEALERARAHVAAIAQASAGLLDRVGSMEGEVSALVDSLRSGAGRLASDLGAVETGMRELYDAASGRLAEEAPVSAARSQSAFAPELEQALAAQPAPPPPQAAPAPTQAPVYEAADLTAAAPAVAQEEAPADAGGELDGARLVALNMALNGESRAETERYLAENFQLPDRLKLIDEVYAAIEG
jgi:DivIVA domain-containing protein